MSDRHASDLQSPRDLIRIVSEATGFRDVVDSLKTRNSGAVDGVWGASHALVTAALAEHLSDQLLLIVLPTVRDVDDFADQLGEFAAEVGGIVVFPAWESLPDEHDPADRTFARRLGALNRLAAADVRYLVTCLPALMQPVPSRSDRAAGTREIAVGEELDSEALLDWLLQRGFDRVTAVEMPGEAAVHGGIIDIFSPADADPVRIELFGDEVESIRTFDVESQRRLRQMEAVTVTASRPAGTGDEGDRPQAQAASSDGESLLDVINQSMVVVFQDLPQSTSEAKLYLQRLSNPVGLYRPEAVLSRLTDSPSVTLDALGADSCEVACHLPMMAVDRFSGSARECLTELTETLGPAESALLCCHNEGELQRLRELLGEIGDAGVSGTDRIQTVVGRLDRGFRFVSPGLLVIGDHELFSRAGARKAVRRPRSQESRAIDTFLDLKEGDLVVHLTQGIARYRGMAMMEGDRDREEHLLLEFRDQVVVYVPVSLIHLVQKYIGPAKTTPQLSKYGGTGWEKKKAQVSDAVTDMASEMLQLQAERNSRPGLQCGPDSALQQEFGDAFPFTPTPDQSTAITSIGGDMEMSRPMDRLICGDVGFGKTEVAMRAAFKAVDNGRQVAVLVPTTVLAEQHYRTFRARMAEFPVEIEMLSRFRSAKEQKQILEKVKAGQIDILIGTHRLVSKDVRFRDLGLLVIDEEQKFGVKVKEKLKHLRLEVDVLTLTATPIPRTLHLSLLGIRDISSLTTPPRERVAVETRVSRFDEALIRSAAVRELNRGGQIYFVHNRVHDIEQIAGRLKQIVPEASLTIAHGQMHEDDLEGAMLDFVSGRADILLATTIIESGLDIPNANTMFIHQAENYGLADLHQLRGRVGRDRHRAYCYLLLEEGKVVTTKAARRLKAIEEYSDLGAGFRIAMRDLEIRGAGNILGTQQSGNIAAVGYELYCQLLENAVRTKQNKPLRYQHFAKIELPLTAYIPDRYIGETRQKIEIYRRLSQTNTLKGLADLEEELRDRFGPIPTPARRMLHLRELNLRAVAWRTESIHVHDGFAVLRFRDRRRMRMLAHMHEGDLKVVERTEACWPLKSEDEDGAGIVQELVDMFSIADPPMEDDNASAD